MTSSNARDPEPDDREDVHGETPKSERETLRGEQGTSSGDPHDDRDPQSG